MSNIIEGVSWCGFLCPLDNKPKKFSTCFSCTKDVCDVPTLRAMGKPFPVIENEYHVTEVIGSPKIMKFRRENAYYIHPDEAIFMFIGTAVHKAIENGNSSVEVRRQHSEELGPPRHERKFTYDLDPYVIVGTMDYVDHNRKLILDYKCLGSWKTRQLIDKAASGEIINDEYGLQLNGYRSWGFPEAETLRLHCIVRDWNNQNSKRYKLPDKQVRINVPIMAEARCDVVAKSGTQIDARHAPASFMDNLARTNIEESLSQYPRDCTDAETWGGMRCKRFCNCWDCLHYGGPEYDPDDAT